MQVEMTRYQARRLDPVEVNVFFRLLTGDISTLEEAEIESSGYVVYTLEASIWCLPTTDCFK